MTLLKWLFLLGPHKRPGTLLTLMHTRDTLFQGGCGRFFEVNAIFFLLNNLCLLTELEGTAAEMQSALARLAELPDATLGATVCRRIADRLMSISIQWT